MPTATEMKWCRQRCRLRREQSHQDEHCDDLPKDHGHDEHRVARQELLRPRDSGEEERDVREVARDVYACLQEERGLAQQSQTLQTLLNLKSNITLSTTASRVSRATARCREHGSRCQEPGARRSRWRPRDKGGAGRDLVR